MAIETQSTPVDPAFQPLHEKIEEAMQRLHVSGVAVGIIVDGEEHLAGFGITNVNHPAPVQADTLFQIGSTTKTVTGTAIMRLVEAGKVALDAPVRRYLPDLRLIDETVAAGVTVRHLLTHTAGWVGDYFADTGRGDDALATIVAQMAELPQLTPLGEIWSYNNAAFYLAGRVIEAVTGKSYEAAVRELVLDPIGMTQSFFFPEEVMIHSFAVGHHVVEEEPKVATPWALARAANPAGGLTSSAGDQMRYARFHMGNGTAQDGARILSPDSIRLMQTPVTSAGGDREIGLSWFLRDVGGVRIVQHGGSTNGQESAFLFAPERRFALTILTNSNLGQLGDEIETWVLERYLGIKEPEPVHEERSVEQLAEYVGKYESQLIVAKLSIDGGLLLLRFTITGEYPADEPPPTPPPTHLAFYAPDRVIALDGPLKGARGEFLRDPEGTIVWLRIVSRILQRVHEDYRDQEGGEDA
jgi:CubicO group peptidase (beta-lactamase class C family)